MSSHLRSVALALGVIALLPGWFADRGPSGCSPSRGAALGQTPASITDAARTGWATRETGSPTMVATEAGVQGMTEAGATEASAPKAIPGPLPRLVDLGAGKCIPCKKMAPVLEEAKKRYEGRAEVVFIDVWEDRSAGEPYGIRMIPTQIFFDQAGKEVFRHEGFLPLEDIQKQFESMGVRSREE